MCGDEVMLGVRRDGVVRRDAGVIVRLDEGVVRLTESGEVAGTAWLS